MTELLQKHARRRERRGRWLLWCFLLLAIAGMFLLNSILAPPGARNSAVALEIAADAQDFEAVLRHGWLEDEVALCGSGAEHNAKGSGLGRLHCHLLVDSLLLVPGYAGLLLCFTILLGFPGTQRSTYLVFLLCVPALAAGLSDIAENILAWAAAVDFIDGVLTDGAVSDVRRASLSKWSLIAVAFAVLAWLAFRAVAVVRAPGAATWPLYTAAGATLLSAVVVGLGAALRLSSLLSSGMLPAGLALALLSWWRLTKFPALAR